MIVLEKKVSIISATKKIIAKFRKVLFLNLTRRISSRRSTSLSSSISSMDFSTVLFILSILFLLELVKDSSLCSE